MLPISTYLLRVLLLKQVCMRGERQPTRLHPQLLRLVFLSLWGVLMASASFGQSIQWSALVGQNNVNISTSSRVFAVERSSDGSLYVLGNLRKPTGVPAFPTTDVQFIGTAGGDQFPVFLSKYSADGSQLLWVRVLQTGANIFPSGLSVSTAGEPTILFVTGGANPAFVTADARQSTPTTSNGGNVLILNKFDTNGNRTYGTYISPVGGGITFAALSEFNNGNNFNTLFTAPDGSTYLSVQVAKGTGQTGVIPTTATAFQSDFTGTKALMVMIFKPDNTLQYSSYFNFDGTLFNNATMSAGGDLYVQMSGTSTLTVPTVASGAASTTPSKSVILRFNKTGSIVASTWQPASVIDVGTITTNPTNGDVVTMGRTSGQVQVFNANLTTLKSNTTPFGPSVGGIGAQIGVDAIGRLHATVWNTNSAPTTPGAIQSAPSNLRNGAYYGITDCAMKRVVYGTYLSDQVGAATETNTILNDFVLDGCSAYIVGQVVSTVGFPVTPTAYNDNGTATVSGYRITPTNSVINRQGFITKFNYPVIRANTNVLTAPAITNFCAGSGLLPIDGSQVTYITPTLLGTADASPAPVPIHYQWQIAGSAAGPWSDIADSDTEDLSPKAPTTPGTYYYRRLVQQTPFEFGASCVPSCDLTDASNVITLSFSANKTHTTNLSSKAYGFCKTGTLAVSTTVTPGTDGAQAPYTYQLTTFNNLTAVAQGQSGTVTAAPFTINLNLADEGTYLLQVTDSRGCISFDTLKAEFLRQDAGSRIQFTCGATTPKLGPASPPSEYANFATNTFGWSPGTGLNNVNLASPTLSILPAVGASADYYLTLNGCLVDTVTVTNESVTPLPTLPDISQCQGETAVLGTGVTSQTGVTYTWVPGLGLTSTSSHTAVLTTLSAPAGVNVTNYTLKAENGTSGCVQYTTQKVTVYRTPNQSFQIKGCMSNGCSSSLALGGTNIGTVSEPGISYSWQAVIKPGTATTGVPTPAQIVAGLTNPTGAMTDFALATPTLGKTTGTYQVLLIRTSSNAANPACMRQDTAFYDYCSCGSGANCALALGALPSVACGGPNNKIGPVQYTSPGTYIWTRLDGTPLNNELFDPITKAALTPGGPHPNQVIANPSGLVAVSYRLTLITPGSDTCRIDIKVFPSAVGKPTVNYTSPQAVCQGTPYTITGPAAIPGLTYLWSPSSALATLADISKALPDVAGLSASTPVYVTVTDPSTGCAVQDTVLLVVSPITVLAGNDATFCSAGASVSVGAGAALPGYTYQWTAVPATGVVFTDPTAAQTSVTLPATTAGGKITLFLSATNGSTAAQCTFTNSVTLTSAAAPTVTIPAVNRLCTGGTLAIGPVSPAGLTYAWSGPGIVGANTGSSITVNATGSYTVVATQESCSGSRTIEVIPAVDPQVEPLPTVTCGAATTIGVNNTPDANWSYSWDKFDGLKSYDADFSNIVVEPTTTTSYTLTATHSSGCVRTYPVLVTASAYVAQLPSTYNFCEGGSSTLALNAAPSGATYAWTASPTSATAYLSSLTTDQPTVNLMSAPAGTYSYSVTVTYSAGCVSTASTLVRVGKRIGNAAGVDAEICNGSCATIGLAAVPGVNYEWSASPTDPTFTNFYSANPTVCPNATTTYTVKYRNESGCVFTDEVLVKVLPTPTLSVTDVVACGPVTLDLATAIIATTGTTRTYWLDAGATIAATNPVNSPGTYYIKSADATCSVIKPVNLTFTDLPTGLAQATYSCATEKGILQISNATAGSRYDYSTGTTYTGTKTFATASVIGGGGILTNSLPTPPFGGQRYTIRLFGADGICTQDYTVNLVDNCPCSLTATAIPGNCASATNQYTVSGVITLLHTSGGTATITDGTQSTTVTVPASATSVAYSLSGLTSGTGSHTVTVTLPGCGTAIRTYTAPANCNLASLGKFVFEDVNANGQQDGADKPIAGVTVSLISSGTLVATTTTNASGNYSFTGLTPGVPYSVSFTAPVGFTATSQNTGNDATDSDGLPATGLTAPVTLTANENNISIDMGYFKPASLGNSVFNDVNKDGQQDGGDLPLAGVTVTLVSNGTVVATTTTNASGTYSFTGLTPGVPYSVSFTTPANFTATTPLAGTNTATDSNPVGGITAPVTLTSGENNTSIDAGFSMLDTPVIQSTTVCAGLPASLTLTGCTGTVQWTGPNITSGATSSVLTVSTAANTAIQQIVSYTASCSTAGSVLVGTVTVNPAVTATISPMNASICAGQTTTLTASGGVSYRWNTGAVTATLSVSAAGTYSVTATSAVGCSGTATTTVTVNPLPLLTATSATICAGQATTLTASGASTYLWSNGNNTAQLSVMPLVTTVYSVTGTSAAGCSTVVSGTVTVNGQPQINSISQSTACVGTVASLTVNATSTGAGVLEYSLNGGVFQTANSFTISAPTATTATVVVRTQGSSCSATESVVVNCACQTPVSLTFVPTALQTCAGVPVSFTVGVSGAISATLISSGTGTFSQNVLTNSGVRTVSYTPSLTDAALGSLTLTLTSADPDGTGSCVADQVMRTLTISPTPSVSATSASVCAGNTVMLVASGASTYLWSNGATTGSISVSVAGPYSVTGTSAQGCVATAIGTLTIYATPAIIPASLPAGVVGTAYSQTLTGSGGSSPYSFSVISGSLPAGLMLTSAGVLSGTPTSNAPASFTVQVTDAKGCTAIQPYSSTLVTASLGDSVFEDVNANGQQDGADKPIAGVTVSLISSGTLVATTTTNASGNYSFTGLTPGVPYSVSFTAPVGFTATGQNTGTDATDSDGLPATGLTAPVTLTANENNISIDMGYFKPASLGNSVFNDVNKDGQQDGGDLPLAGVTVTLVSNGTVVATTTTNASGTYSFTGLTPGVPYSVSFTTPANFTAASANIGNDATDSDPLGGITAPVTLTSGENNTSIDAGFSLLDTPVIQSTTVCAGLPASLTLTGCTGTVQWTGPNITSGQTSVLLTVLTAANTAIQQIVSYTASCSTAGSVLVGTVTVNPAVTATISPMNASICAGQTTTLTASGGVSYRWNTGAATATLSVSAAGTYSVTATSAVGCSGTATTTVTVNPLPLLTATSATICAGQATTLTASGASTYLWSNGNNTALLSVMPLVTTVYSVTGTSAAGCTTVVSGTVTVNGQPQINSISQSTACVGTVASLTVNATNTGAGVLEYSLNGGVFQTANSFTISAPTATTATVVVRTQGSSCSATESVVVNCACVTPVILTFVPTTLQTCAGSPVSFTAGVSGATSASLTSNGTGTFSQSVISGQQTVSYQPSLSDATAGSVTLTLRSADPDGVGSCAADQVTRVLTINPLPSVSATSVSVCAGESGILTASGASTYRWNTGATTQSISVSVAGTYSVTGTTAQGCSATASGTLTVYPALTLSPASLPAGVVGVAYSQTITASGGVPAYTFSSLGSLPNGLNLGTSTGVLSGTPTSAAPASFTVRVTDSKSCSAALPYTIGVVTASLGDYVFEDVNKDGLQNAGDIPISGAVVTLLLNGSAVATTTTSTSGIYSFTGLTPGVPYSVSFATPTGFSVSTSANVGSDDALDSDAINGLTGSYTLSAGENNRTIDAGFVRLAPPTPRLILAKLVSKGKAKLGEVISYTVVLINTGPVTATSVVVNDVFTRGLNLAPGSVSVSMGSFTPGLQGGTWAIASLPVGTTATLTYSASITAEGVIYNTATIPGTEVQVCTTVPFSVCKGRPFSIELGAASGYSRYQWYYTAPNSTSATLVADGTLDSFTATLAGEYQVTVDAGLGGPCARPACCPILIEETEVPSYTALVKHPTCVGTTPQANGEITLMNLGVAPTAYVYQVSAGSSFTATTAVPVQPIPVPANGLVSTGLAGGNYTVRVWVLIDGEPSCPRDVTVALVANCDCPEEICLPVIIRKTKSILR